MHLDVRTAIFSLRWLSCSRRAAWLRLSDYGVKPEDAGELADNAASTMGALFRVDPRTLSREEIMDIIIESI